MKPPRLYFRGHAFPAATATEWAATPPSVGRSQWGDDTSALRSKSRDWSSRRFAILESNGKGRVWTITRPLGFWRNFATADHQDEAQVLGLVHRYGDPIGRLPLTSDTLSW